MCKFLITILTFFITVTSVQSQSLKSVSGNEFAFKDSEYLQNIEVSQIKKSEFAKDKKRGDYITFSTGIFPATKEVSSNKIIPYILSDLNINILNVIYLDLGAGAMFANGDFYFAGKGGMGFVYDIIPDKFFTFAGVGLAVWRNSLTNFILIRLNYKLSKSLSVGLDNKFFNFSEPSDNFSYKYSIGLNISHRFNY